MLATASAREILTGLHDVMASRAGPQAKLNRVVKLIADAMHSEVCSIYLLRDGVLSVQHADPRGYDDVEIEALQTVAMVLSELIAGAGLADRTSTSTSVGR